MLHGMGVDTGIDLDRLVEAGGDRAGADRPKLAGKYLQAALGEREKKAPPAARRPESRGTPSTPGDGWPMVPGSP